jgi:hypothetical protein
MSTIALNNTNKVKALNALKAVVLYLSNFKPVLAIKVLRFS